MQLNITNSINPPKYMLLENPLLFTSNDIPKKKIIQQIIKVTIYKKDLHLEYIILIFIFTIHHFEIMSLQTYQSNIY